MYNQYIVKIEFCDKNLLVIMFMFSAEGLTGAFQSELMNFYGTPFRDFKRLEMEVALFKVSFNATFPSINLCSRITFNDNLIEPSIRIKHFRSGSIVIFNTTLSFLSTESINEILNEIGNMYVGGPRHEIYNWHFQFLST